MPSVTAPHATAATTSKRLATTSFSVPPLYVATNTAAAPTASGIAGTATARPRNALLSSNTAAIMMTIVKATNSHFTMNNDAATAPPSRTPIVIAARRLRPAFGPGTAGGSSTSAGFTSDLEKFDFLVPQHLVDLGDVAMRQVVEFLLRAMDVVLASLATLLELVECLFRVAANIAYRDPRVLRFGTRQLDVVAPTFFGELWDADPDHVAVIGWIHTEVGVADRFLDRAQCALVIRADDDHSGVGDREPGELVQRRDRPVVLDDDAREHSRVCAAGPDRREAVLRDAHSLFHLLFGLEEGVVDHWSSLLQGHNLFKMRKDYAGRRSAGASTDHRPDLLTVYGPADVAVLQQVEDQDRHRVVAAEADRRRVSEFQVASQHLVVVQRVEPNGVRVGLGVAVVDAVDALGHQHHLGADLECALRRRCVSREKRRTKARSEDDDAALLQVPDRPTRNVGLGDLPHRDSSLHARLDVLLLEEILQREAVHDGSKHAHVVGASAVHTPHGQLGAAEEVAPADDHGNLNAFGHDDTDLLCNRKHDVGIDAERAIARKRLSGQLQHDPLITLIRRDAISARHYSAELDLVRIGQLRAPHLQSAGADGGVGRHRWPAFGRRPSCVLLGSLPQDCPTRNLTNRTA